MENTDCKLVTQGGKPGGCGVKADGKSRKACLATVRKRNGKLERLIYSINLSRPENYLSIYQSGCNMACKKCHSWHFSQEAEGRWMSPEQIAAKAATYEQHVTWIEARRKATAWHASDNCLCCGNCVLQGVRSTTCPSVLEPESILASPQGFGPARNIVGFTGGDLTCCPEFYGECATLIKVRTQLWVLIETNGYGLTPANLDYLRDSGVDAFWLDIKAFDSRTHEWLTGCSNEGILRLPEEMIGRGFVLEILSLYIPKLVEGDQLEEIARLITKVDSAIPFTVLAFFPEYLMQHFPAPSVRDMVDAYLRVKSAGLKNVRLGNVGVFVRTEEDRQYLSAHVKSDGY